MPHFPTSPGLTEWTLSLILFCVCALKVNTLLCLHIRLKELTLLGTDAKPQLAIWGSHCWPWDWRQTYSHCVQVSAVIAVSLCDSVGQCALPCSIICPAVNSLWQNPSFLLSAPRKQPCPWTPANQILPPWTPEKNWGVYAVRKRTRERE